MSRVFILKDGSVSVGRKTYQIIGYVHEKKKEDELVVELIQEPSAEPTFDAIKFVLEDKSLPDDITIITSNVYVVKALTVYWKAWEKTHWKTKTGSEVRDREIIEEILNLPQPKYQYLKRESWPKELAQVEDLMEEEGRAKAEEMRKTEPKRKLTVRGSSSRS